MFAARLCYMKHVYSRNHQPDEQRLLDMMLSNLNHFEQEMRQYGKHFPYNYDWAKIYLVLLDNKTEEELENADEAMIECILRVVQIFENEDSYKLQLISTQKLCMMMNKEKDTEMLVEYCNKGFILATKVKLPRYEKWFKAVLDRTEERIKSQYQNKIMFLSSYPFKQEKNIKEPEFALQRDYRSTIISMLDSVNKNIKVYFDVITKESLAKMSCKNEGCKILILDINYSSDEGLVLEDGKMGPADIPIDYIEKMEEDPSQALNVDIIIVLSDNPKPIVQAFKKTLVKFIVYFDFEGPDEQPKHTKEFNIFEAYWKREFKCSFLQKFMPEYLKNGNVLNCLNQAKIETPETMRYRVETESSLFKSTVDSYKASSLQEVAKMEPNFDTSNIKFIQNSCDSFVDNKMEAGSVTLVHPDLCKGLDLPDIYIRRDFEVWQLYQKLQAHRTVILTGLKGSGKSFVAKQLIWELSYRRIYPDGVYYFELKDIEESSTSIRQFMAKQFEEKMYEDTENYFHKKKMLIVFDSYDRVLNRELKEPKYLIDILKEKEISLLLIQNKNQSENLKNIKKPDQNEFFIEPFTPKQSLMFIFTLAACYKTFFSFNESTAYKLTRSDTIKECSGLPSNLIKKKKRFLERSLSVSPLDVSRLIRQQSFASPLTKDQQDMIYSYKSKFESSVMGEDKSFDGYSIDCLEREGSGRSSVKHHADSKKDLKKSKHRDKRKKSKNKKQMN